MATRASDRGSTQGAASERASTRAPRQPSQLEVQEAVRANPKNALAIIMEAGSRECGYGWHTTKFATQYVPVDVERSVTKTEYVDRIIAQPVVDQKTMRELAQCKEEIAKLRELQEMPDGIIAHVAAAAAAANSPAVHTAKNTTVHHGLAHDRLDQSVRSDLAAPSPETARLAQELRNARALVAKRDEQIEGLQAAVLQNFRDARGGDDDGVAAAKNSQRQHTAQLQGKIVLLQNTLRGKEQFIQEVTQALVDMTNVVSGMQRETKHMLQSELADCQDALEINRNLEARIKQLEEQALRLPEMDAALEAHVATIQELQQQLDDKDDIISALEDQFRAEMGAGARGPAELANPSLSLSMSVGGQAAALEAQRREATLVRLTQLRFRIGLKNAAILRLNNELCSMRLELSRQGDEAKRLATLNEDGRRELLDIMQEREALKMQVNKLRREVLTSRAQSVRPLVFPTPMMDDDTRLMEAPTAPRTRYLTEQDIVAAYSLFDASAQGELPAWDMQLYLRCLGFPPADPAVKRIANEYRRSTTTLGLDDFREVVLDLQRQFTPLLNCGRPDPNLPSPADNRLLKDAAAGGQLTARDPNGGGGAGLDRTRTGASDVAGADPSQARAHISKASLSHTAAAMAELGVGASIEKQYTRVRAISVRKEPLTMVLIEAAFHLFDYDSYGELDRKDVCTLAHALGLVGCTADLEALQAIVQKEFSGTLNIDEWIDLVQFCQGLRPTFVRHRVLEHKPPKDTLYPPAYPRAGRANRLSAKDVQTAFQLFDADASGLIPGHQLPTYLACLGLVCSGPEFTALLITEYRADLTQKVDVDYFSRIVRFIQSNLQFFQPPTPAPPVRSVAVDPSVARDEAPIMAPRPAERPRGPPITAGGAPSAGAEDDADARAALPTRPNTAVYSPRTRGEGSYPPWMLPAAMPAQVHASPADAARAKQMEREVAGFDSPGRDTSATRPPAVRADSMSSQHEKEASLMRLMQRKASNDFTTVTPVPDIRELHQVDVLQVYVAFVDWFGRSAPGGTQSKLLALPHVVWAVRSLGFLEVSRRFLEGIWPYKRLAETLRDAPESARPRVRSGLPRPPMGAAGPTDDLVLDESEFISLVKSLCKYGTPRDAGFTGLPKPVNRYLVGGALATDDVRRVFTILDDDSKEFISYHDFRTLLTLMGFTTRDEQEVQQVILDYDRTRASRTSRERRVFELDDCVEVLRRLTAAPVKAHEGVPMFAGSAPF